MKKQRSEKSILWGVLAICAIALIIYLIATRDGGFPEGVVEQPYTDISVQEARTLLEENPDIIIIDVSPNYDEGHLPGAINYYVGDGSLDEAIPTLDKESTYLVYCHFESASRAGAQKLTDAGFGNVYRLRGDYPAWVNAGYEIEQ